MLTIVAYPALPEPELVESEPEEEDDVVDPEVEVSEVVESELLEVVAGAGFALVGGLGRFPDPRPHGTEKVLRAKKPMVIRTVVAGPKERIVGNGLSI